MRFLLWVLFFWLLPLGQPFLRAAEPRTITLASLLEEMTDPATLARWPAPAYTCKLASSYDREKSAPDQPGWFSNHDYSQFVRTELNGGRQESVMMDADGPGVIVRFWLTAAEAKKGTLRIYLDGNEAPAVTFQGFDLFQSGLAIPEPLLQAHPGYNAQRGGANLYLPIPYAKHCKVTWEEGSQGARYYQITYRTYPPATVVETFSRARLDGARTLLGHTAHQLLTPASAWGATHTLKYEVKAGTEATLDLPTGPRAISELTLHLPVNDPGLTEQALRSLIIQTAFDGEATIWCPVTDFFGSGVGLNEVRDFYQQVNKEGLLTCRWVMPYQGSASITLQNLGAKPVAIELTAKELPWAWDNRSMHFHTQWHYESGLKTNPVRDWNFITMAGRGVWVGDTLALFNPVATWYGEGDEKIWVDGEKFPSDLGTGTEDYFGYSYAPQGIIQTPFMNQVRAGGKVSQGHNVESRLRLLDGIPFERDFRFDWELISWKPTSLTYAATAHWYALPRATSNVAPEAAEAMLPVPTQADFQATPPGE